MHRPRHQWLEGGFSSQSSPLKSDLIASNLHDLHLIGIQLRSWKGGQKASESWRSSNIRILTCLKLAEARGLRAEYGER